VGAGGIVFGPATAMACRATARFCVTALETALSGTFRLILAQGFEVDLPRAETPSHHITMGFNEDLDDAAKTALREMITLIGERLGLSPRTPICSAALPSTCA